MAFHFLRAGEIGDADFRGRLWRLFDRVGVLAYLLVLVAVFGIIKPDSLTLGTGATVIQLSIPLLVVAAGMTFCLLCGEVDLSVGGVTGLASTVAAVQMSGGTPWPLAVLAALGVGLLVGIVNGALTAWLLPIFPRFPSFLVTLATMALTAGIAQSMQPLQQAVAIENDGFRDAFDFSSSLLTSTTTWYALITVAVAYVVLTRTSFGYAIYAVGANARAARLVGFRVVRTKFAVMVVSGFLAAIGGVLMAGYVQAGFFQLGRGIELDAIAAAVIGGVALFGGRGSIIGAMWGVLVIGVLNTGLLLLEAQTNVQLIAKGGLVVIALAFGEYVRRRASNA